MLPMFLRFVGFPRFRGFELPAQQTRRQRVVHTTKSSHAQKGATLEIETHVVKATRSKVATYRCSQALGPSIDQATDSV